MTHKVAALVIEGANLFEISIAHEVFGLRRPELGPTPLYELVLCSRSRQAHLSSGLSVTTPGDLRSLEDADTVIVPFGLPTGEVDDGLVEALREAHRRGARLASFCSGAFTLAATGLLDGRRATTHWRFADEFRRRYPRVTFDPNVLYVDEGDVLTSAGSAAAIDLALHMVRGDHGADVAAAIARRMVVPPLREGGQAQFIAPPHEPRVTADGLGHVLDWILAHLHRDVSVDELSRMAAMSRRTFARRFKEATGTTPVRWIQMQRLHRAQQLLETTDLDMEQVASRSGFGSGTNLRVHFRRELHTTPSRYRRAFRAARAPEPTAMIPALDRLHPQSILEPRTTSPMASGT